MTFGTGGVRPPPNRLDGDEKTAAMRRLGADEWSGLLAVLVCAAAGVPVLVAVARGDSVTTVPPWLWVVVFGVFLAAMVICMVELVRPAAVPWVFGIQVVAGPVLVLAAPSAGLTPILLVFTAAVSAYLVSRPVTVVVVVLNSAVIAWSLWSITDAPGEVLMVTALYVMIQSATVLAVVAQEHEVRLRRELAVAHTELRATSALLADSSRADERLRIARELHDLIGHQLTVLALELEVASHRATPPALEHVTRAREVARELLADVRETVGEMRSSAPDLRESLARIVADLPGLDVELTVDDEVSVDEERSAALVRCAQEVVTNTLRHSGATRLRVAVTVDGDRVVLTGHDNGQGATQVTIGNGLRGITERAESLGGHVEFTADDGFRVVASVVAR